MKAAQIMELVTAEAVGISAAELAARLKLPRQSVHRNIRALEQMGFVVRAVGGDKYAIGPTLLRLANTVMLTSYERGPWRAVLQELGRQTDESCTVAVLDGFEIVYVDRVESVAPLRVQLQVGDRVPAYSTAIGKLLLAHLPPRALRKLIDTVPMQKHALNTITDRSALEAELEKVRQQGYAINNQEFIAGIVSIAVPIRSADGRVVAGIGVHSPVMRVAPDDVTRFLPPLSQAAKRLEALHRNDADAAGTGVTAG